MGCRKASCFCYNKLMTDSKKILFIEDNEMLRRALLFKFGNAGFTVEYAANGEEALATLHAQTFDLIVLDFIMPRMDGFTFLKEIKKRGIETPVIGLTNLSQEEDMRKAMELGVVKYLTKTDEHLTQLVDVVKEILSK